MASAVAARLEPGQAAQATASLIQVISKTKEADQLRALAKGLSAVLSRQPTPTSQRRYVSVTHTLVSLAAPGSLFAGPGLLQPALEPLPPPLPAQSLVDLLKHPCCVGEARRLVLHRLQRHYNRPFADQWDFVRFATQQKLGLDLTSPPQRPR